jgi:anti-sigma factor RsiW
MPKDPLFDHLCEQAWRGKLSPGQEAQLRQWFAAHPGDQDSWLTETGLNEALARLPDVPVPSNFTARVLRAIELDSVDAERRVQRKPFFPHRWLRWVAACLIILAGTVAYLSYLDRLHSEQLVNSIAAVSLVAPLPSPEILTNFDVICALDRTPPPDEDLLKLLQ